MITNITIENYKSIEKAKIQLGRINVFIGENGAGKTNFLEAIALAGAASAEKLDTEFLTSRGIRMTDPQYMRSAFEGFDDNKEISISVENHNNTTVSFKIKSTNEPYPKWSHRQEIKNPEEDALAKNFGLWLRDYVVPEKEQANDRMEQAKALFESMKEYIELAEKKAPEKELEKVIKETVTKLKNKEILNVLTSSSKTYNEITAKLSKFLIYSPENSSLRTLEKEGQISPLGINGEGLIKLINILTLVDGQAEILQIKQNLKMLGWFEDLFPIETANEYSLEIKDKYLDSNRCTFDQKSANEGFLFLAFYYTLFTTQLTPHFFAVDNIDTALNPKLCQKLIKQLNLLSEEHDKQAILTTHNPAILDGLNLNDENQRLFVIARTRDGKTKITRIKPNQIEDTPKLRLSEMFMRGLIGGLPKGF